MKQFIQRHIVLLGIVIIGALAGLGFVACTSDDDVLNRLDENVTADSNPRLRTEAEAIEIAIGNLGMIDRAVPRSRAASDIVADVSVIGSKVKSRNGATNDTLLYAVNFKNNEGFALVPASRKADPLLAICEKGNYSPGCEKLNPGFGIYMNIAEKRLTDLETVSDEPTLNTGDKDSEFVPEFKPYDGDNTRPLETKETSDTSWICRIAPRIQVKWGQQGNVYARYAPNDYAGCAPVAMAQTMSYFKYPSKIAVTFPDAPISELNLDWDYMMMHNGYWGCNCYMYNYAQNHEMIAVLMRQLGQIAQSDYTKSNGTETFTSKTRDTLKKLGLSVSDISDYKPGKTADIADGIILMRGDCLGKNNKLEGHIWIIDGVKRFVSIHKCYVRENSGQKWTVMNESKDILHFNHINWGWYGNQDGWFNDGVFNALIPVEYSYNNQDTGIDSPNFTMNLKYFVVYK